ncbi:MAG TPA: DUF4097 family beta strand repeat-containing protein [Candidatus Wallbacteria bacterium]|nr:DUF4097 family beta strand repeat-containing protein [Candidatus Wallbacteria bacterium]
MEERFLKNYNVDSGGKLEVKNINGHITITGWEKDTVEVGALKKISQGALSSLINAFGSPINEKEEFDNVSIDVKNDRNNIYVETRYLKQDSKVSVDYEIKVPLNVLVGTVKNMNGRISLENTLGDSNLETLNGKIEVNNANGTIKARSGNGGISICKTAGISSLETSNGLIEADVSGIKNDIDLKSSNGKIIINMPKNIDAEIELKTSVGKISVSGFELEKSNSSGNRFEGRIGKGGHRLRAVTSVGKVELNCKG